MPHTPAPTMIASYCGSVPFPVVARVPAAATCWSIDCSSSAPARDATASRGMRTTPGARRPLADRFGVSRFGVGRFGSADRGVLRGLRLGPSLPAPSLVPSVGGDDPPAGRAASATAAIDEPVDGHADDRQHRDQQAGFDVMGDELEA